MSPLPTTDLEGKSSDQTSPTSSEAEVAVIQYEKGVDEAADLLTENVGDVFLDVAEARRIRNKIDWVVLPLLLSLYLLQFMDKGNLAASAVLGVIEDNNLTADEFNTLGSAFYIGYIVFAYPHSWALQRYPVAKYLSVNIFLWSVFMGLQCVCKNFGGLFILRFLLGASEGCVINGIMVVTSMFYNRTEIGERIGWTFQCNGIATIVSGFLSFGVAHFDQGRKPARWQLLMIIYTVLTLVIAIYFLLRFPDSPVKARFLTEDEKVKAVRRIQSNQSGIETKTWKRDQAVEAVKDIKTWLFFLLAAVADLQNGFFAQYSLIIQSFGFTTVQTTALSIPAGAAQIISIILSTVVLRHYPNARCWIAIGFFMPSVLGAVLLMTLPWDNQVGLLCAYYVINFGGAPSWAVIVSWVAVTTSGHTKKLMVNAIFLIGFALGQILCTQFWRAEYKPRNLVPWGICLASYVGDFILLFSIHYVLAKENKRRDAMNSTEAREEYGYIERVDPAGRVVRQKVNKSMLDMTDRQNLAFRYAL